ncbi:MAG: hypothetical protein RIC89_00175 [Pseudomonadales bacterium]
MKEAGTSCTAFWNHLLTLSEEIATSNSAPSLAELNARLLTVEEAYARTFDPADHFPEYVSVLLCKSIKQLIEQHIRQSE